MKTVFTTGEAAKILKVAPRTVCKWFDAGRLRGYRIPGSQDRRIPRERLVQFMKDNGLEVPAELQETKLCAAGQAVLEQVRALASGTLSGLTGFHEYADLDAAHAKFLEYTQAYCEANSGDVTWESWQDAWETFVGVYPKYQKAAAESAPEPAGLNRDRVLGYAVNFACYSRGHGYGQQGEAPRAPAELTDQQAEAIRRAVRTGIRAAVAREEKDEPRAAGEREYHQKSRPLAKLCGFSGGLIDECFESGYRAVRGDSLALKGLPVPEPMACAERVTPPAAPAILERGGWRAEMWPNKLGWNVGKAEEFTEDADGPHEVTAVDGGASVTVVDAAGEPHNLLIAGAEDAIDAVALAFTTLAAEAETWPDALAPEPAAPVDPNTPQVRPFLLLPPNLAALAKLTAADSRFVATRGVQLTSTAQGYRAVATNGKLLGMVEGEPPAGPDEFPDVPALRADAAAAAAEVVIDGKEWAKAFKAVPKRPFKPALGSLAVAPLQNETVFATTDCETVNVARTRNVDGRFPNVNSVLKAALAKPVKARFRVDPKLLCDLVTAAAAFCPEDGHCVEVEVVDKQGMIVVRSQSPTQKFTGLLVPLTYKK